MVRILLRGWGEDRAVFLRAFQWIAASGMTAPFSPQARRRSRQGDEERAIPCQLFHLCRYPGH